MRAFRWFVAGALAVGLGYGCRYEESGSAVGAGSTSGSFGSTSGGLGGTAGTPSRDEPVSVPLGVIGSDVLPTENGLGGAGGDGPMALGGQGGQAGQGTGIDQGGQAGTPGTDDMQPTADEPMPGVPVLDADALVAGIWDDHSNHDWFGIRETVLASDLNAVLPVTETELTMAREAMAPGRIHEQLDVALLLDTTGSMGDELGYLKTRWSYIWEQIALAYPNARQRWALVGYRDQGDDYVTKPVDFTDRKQEFAEELTSLEAYGGGDVPEASDRALKALLDLSWRGDAATARMAFWFTDAPHHAGSATSVSEALLAASDAGIKLYPVASSNASTLTTDTLRLAALLTGGRYLFLLDRNASGSTSALPCFYVTELKQTMLRAVHVEMDGRYVPPPLETLIAAQGMPVAGTCNSAPFTSTAY